MAECFALMVKWLIYYRHQFLVKSFIICTKFNINILLIMKWIGKNYIYNFIKYLCKSKYIFQFSK